MYLIPKVNRNIHESIDDLEKDQNQKKKIKNQQSTFYPRWFLRNFLRKWIYRRFRGRITFKDMHLH